MAFVLIAAARFARPRRLSFFSGLTPRRQPSPAARGRMAQRPAVLYATWNWNAPYLTEFVLMPHDCATQAAARAARAGGRRLFWEES
jgi:hypothetical protein